MSGKLRGHEIWLESDGHGRWNWWVWDVNFAVAVSLGKGNEPTKALARAAAIRRSDFVWNQDMSKEVFRL